MLVRGGYDARYVTTGHLIYTLDDGLLAVVFDADTLTVSGGAVPLVDEVMRGGIFTGTAHYGVADDGTLVYVRGTSATAVRGLRWVDRDGRQERINAPPHNYLSAQISPDGRRIALMAFDEEFDTWIWDVERETLQRLTFGPDLNFSPIWSPDGRRIAFSAGPDEAREVYWQAADGSGGLEPLTSDTPGSTMPFDFSPDGTTLIHGVTQGPSDIWAIAIDGSTTSSTPLIATPANERSATVSPDGRWVAYQSDESGQYEIYVRSFPDVGAGGLWQISNAGGTSPLWSRDGRELFYFDEGPPGGETSAVMAVSVETDEIFRPGSPETLFQGAYLSPQIDGTFYDVSADGQRFLMISNIAVADDEAGEPKIIIVENWFEELEQRVPTE